MYTKNIIKSASLTLCLIFAIGLTHAQDIYLKNPSFEDRAHFGGNNNNSSIKGWYDCGQINFPSATPPDIHQGANRDTAFWDNEVATAHGKTYLGMVVRDNESWESVSQRLSTPLRVGKCYSFSIYLSRSSTYNSRTMGSRLQKEASFTTPAVLRIWGGNGYCGDTQLLGESLPVDHSEWKEYVFQFEPNADYSVITLEAFYKTPLFFPYNGHILLDNSSDLDIVPCEENYVVYTKEVRDPREKILKKMPAHKAKAKKQKIFKREVVENKVDTVIYKRPKADNVLSLDRNKMKQGQKIRIDHLYFAADTSSISDDSYEVLDEVYDFLNINDDIKIELGGHTNRTPDHSYCDELSEARAKAVADYLISKGIASERISYKGYGKRKPVSRSFSEESRKKNQRVEIKIISMG